LTGPQAIIDSLSKQEGWVQLNSFRKIGRRVLFGTALAFGLAAAGVSFGQEPAAGWDAAALLADQTAVLQFCPWTQDPDNPPGSGTLCAEQVTGGKGPLTRLQIDFLDATGALEFSTQFSSERSIGEMFQSVSDSAAFAALSGRTTLTSVARSLEGRDGTEYRRTILAGYDPQGSSGLLTGSGETSTLVTNPDAGWMAAVGFSNLTAAGTLISRVRVDEQSLERYFSSNSFGQVTLDSSAASGSQDSRQSYSQTISVNGEADVSQTTRFSFGSSFSDICPWQLDP
jgi:hypothetical protein